MAVLSDTERQRLATGLMRYWSANNEPVGATKAQVRTLVNDTDAWQDSAAGAAAPATGYNSGISVGIRTLFTTPQKVLTFSMVALSRTDPQLVRRILTEVG